MNNNIDRIDIRILMLMVKFMLTLKLISMLTDVDSDVEIGADVDIYHS